jgi:DNA-binding CsgD family transcriptional regulator
MSQTTISNDDLSQMLAITRRYGDEQGDALPWELLQDLMSLVSCDLLSAFGLDSTTMAYFSDQEVGSTSELTPAEEVHFTAMFEQHYWDSVCSYPDRTGQPGLVFRCSDIVPDAEWRQGGMYADYDRPLGIEHELMVCLDAGRPQRTLRLLFARGAGSDFSERDVAVLTLLQPHLQSAYVAAERRRRGLRPLTDRQRQILQYIAAGYTNGQIATRLDVSEHTVRKHVENIFARLDVTSRTAAARLWPPT